MFCSKCGKEISDQAKFCNYCGNPVNNAQPQTPPAPQTARVSQPTAVPQSAPAKNSKVGRTILTIVVAVIVFFSVRAVTENALSGQDKDTSYGGTGNYQTSQSQDSAFEQGFQDALTQDSDVRDAMNSCVYGGLYQNSSLRYGLTKLYMPGYYVLAGEEDERDWLVSLDGAYLLTVYKQYEIMDVSFDASTEEALLDSYIQSYGDAAMIEFDKLYVNGFPVIRCIIGYTMDGAYQYQGELIVFPSETSDETIRVALFADPASGGTADGIRQVFDTLDVSPEYMLTGEDTQVVGQNRITER